MAKVVSDIAVRVAGDIGPLQNALRRGSREVDTFGSKTRRVAANVARAGTVIAGGLAAATAGGIALARNAADAGAEIENLSRLAGAAPERFQRMAYAAKTVGVEQDKLADQLKDVRDRVGDFLATGSGPMADFFEKIAPKVGVTAEQFRNLSGPESLQLYVNSLERAGVSQNQMTFYLEALSSDLSRLQPLLAENGTEMRRLGDEAASSGQVMSNDAVRGATELQRELQALTGAIQTQVNEAILEHKDEIIRLVDTITGDWLPNISRIAEAMGDTIAIIDRATEAISNFGDAKIVAPNFDGSGALGPTGGLADSPSSGAPAMTQEEADRLYGPMISGGGGTGDIDGSAGMDRLSFVSGGGGSGFLGGGSGDLGETSGADMLESLQAFFERRNEIVSDGLATEREMTRDSAERIRSWDEMSRRQRLNTMSGLFGDLSSLMQTENEKLFKIGQAAATAEAVVTGYQAAVEAWEKGMKVAGPPTAAAWAGASLARTGALISQIQSTSLSGTSVGGAPGGSAGAASGGAQEMNKFVTVDLRGNGLSRDDKQALVSTLNEAIGDGYRLKGMRMA